MTYRKYREGAGRSAPAGTVQGWGWGWAWAWAWGWDSSRAWEGGAPASQ